MRGILFGESGLAAHLKAGHRRDGVVHHRLRRCSGHCRGAGGVPAIDARRAGIGRRRESGRRRHDGDGLRERCRLCPTRAGAGRRGRQSLPHRERHWSWLDGKKIIHQLLAGVHIAVAAEAMALAARAGIPLETMYDVVTHAAGNSRMFENRMQHVSDGDYSPKSAVDIFLSKISGW
uniref:Putative oxidoreductase YgbJ n=1 Tax=Klebsiella pneumoniae TaxID=573 RepID=A0A8B0SUX9_KLEPN|nr:putative oxidoreductase YgbJ [Klebsiella pneumoniae]